METEIDHEILHDNVQDAVADWDEPFDPRCVDFGVHLYQPHKYNYVVENLAWW